VRFHRCCRRRQGAWARSRARRCWRICGLLTCAVAGWSAAYAAWGGIHAQISRSSRSSCSWPIWGQDSKKRFDRLEEGSCATLGQQGHASRSAQPRSASWLGGAATPAAGGSEGGFRAARTVDLSREEEKEDRQFRLPDVESRRSSVVNSGRRSGPRGLCSTRCGRWWSRPREPPYWRCQRRLEMDLGELSPEDAAEFKEALGAGERPAGRNHSLVLLAGPVDVVFQLPGEDECPRPGRS